jgi:glutaminyl-peptide cyclotransferase
VGRLTLPFGAPRRILTKTRNCFCTGPWDSRAMRIPFFAILLLLVQAASAVAEPACPASRQMRFELTGQVRRSDLGFTEGFEMHDGMLYESTGDVYGTSRLERIDPRTGKATVLKDAGHDYFGEGLTIFDNLLYQMTWKEHRVFVFDLTGRPLKEFSNPREGWGLTHDATRLIASDGSDHLFFLRPGDFITLGSIAVREGALPVSDINELEYVDGAIYANVFMSWRVLKISPVTGCVLAAADLSSLHERFSPADRSFIDAESNFVLNGIAYDPATRLFTLTGKYWPLLFTGRFVEG